MSELDKPIVVFRFDEDEDGFEEENYHNIEDVFDSNQIIIIVDHLNKIIWIWHGSKAIIRLKFIATQEAPKIRDHYGIDYKILAVDEGVETKKFKEIFEFD